jgi:hypothetical protein
MSRKRTTAKSSPKPPVRKAAPGNNNMLLISGLIVIVVIAGVAWATSRPKVVANASGAASNAGAPAAAVPADEQKYIGRFLPAGYQEPTVPPVTYTAVTNMTDVTAQTKGAQLTVSLADVTAAKIVYFEYAKAGSDPVPMIAYVKPSGKLFVGVSYCIPCKGKKDLVDADGTLTCASCGTKRDLETGVGISGTCRLYPLDEIASQVVGGKIVIEKSALDKWTPQPLDRPVG